MTSSGSRQTYIVTLQKGQSHLRLKILRNRRLAGPGWPRYYPNVLQRSFRVHSVVAHICLGPGVL